jgi:hypothetical protein
MSAAANPPVVIIQDVDDTNHTGGHKKKRAKTNSRQQRSSQSSSPSVFHPDSNELLTNMLHPLQPSTFLHHHFRKDAVHIQRHNHRSQDQVEQMVHDICHNYLFGLDVQQIFRETSSENVFLWLHHPPTSTSPSNDPCNDSKVPSKAIATSATTPTQTPTLNSVEISDPDTAYALHQSGLHSAYCRAPPILEQHLVSSLLRTTGLGGGHYHAPHSASSRTLGGGTTLGRGEVELFISGGSGGSGDGEGSSIRNHHVTGWHTDFQENFTIQLSGVKRWTLRRGRVRHPLRGTTPHYARDASVVENQLKVARLSCLGSKIDDDSNGASFHGRYGFDYDDNNAYGPEQTITLHTGDVLYFPAGMWHKVETVEPGISLNVSLMGTTYAKLVCEALQHVMYGSDEGWREIVTTRPGDANANGVQRLDGLLSGLSSLVHTFVQAQGGAQSLLPPALLHPPLRQNHGGSMEDIGDDDDECDNDDDNDVDDDDDDKDDGDGDIVIVVDQFKGPSSWTCAQPPNARLVKNPLASLISMPDISKQKQDAGRFILNVNFAGNEMMESHLRVVLETSERELVDQLKFYVSCEGQGEDPGHAVNNPKKGEAIALPPKCLFYFGYFSWKI